MEALANGERYWFTHEEETEIVANNRAVPANTARRTTVPAIFPTPEKEWGRQISSVDRDFRADQAETTWFQLHKNRHFQLRTSFEAKRHSFEKKQQRYYISGSWAKQVLKRLLTYKKAVTYEWYKRDRYFKHQLHIIILIYSQLKIKSDTVILIFGIKFFLYMTYTLRITNYLLQNTLHLLQHFVTLGNISIHRIANLIISWRTEN